MWNKIKEADLIKRYYCNDLYVGASGHATPKKLPKNWYLLPNKRANKKNQLTTTVVPSNFDTSFLGVNVSTTQQKKNSLHLNQVALVREFLPLNSWGFFLEIFCCELQPFLGGIRSDFLGSGPGAVMRCRWNIPVRWKHDHLLGATRARGNLSFLTWK